MMRRTVLSAVALLMVVAVSGFAAGRQESEGGSALAFAVSGGDTAGGARFARVLVELQADDPSIAPIRVSLHGDTDVVVVRGVQPATYTVTMAHYGVVDGSYLGQIEVPQTSVVVGEQDVTVAPFQISFVGSGIGGVAWRQIDADERSAVQVTVTDRLADTTI